MKNIFGKFITATIAAVMLISALTVFAQDGSETLYYTRPGLKYVEIGAESNEIYDVISDVETRNYSAAPILRPRTSGDKFLIINPSDFENSSAVRILSDLKIPMQGGTGCFKAVVTELYGGYLALATENISYFFGIYDEVNNVLYMGNNGEGYISYIRSNGTAKYEYYEQTHYSFDHQSDEFEGYSYMVRFKKFPHITVSYDGSLISFDQNPVAENGRTLVPLRAIFETLGATVSWDGATQTVTAVKDNTTVSLTLDNAAAKKNGETITLDIPAKAINGRTMVPVRFIADSFGVDVDWDANLRRVVLTSK